MLLNKIFTNEQHSFIRKRSTCTSYILASMHDWCLNMQSHIPTDNVYFDFKIAFYSVLHPKLLPKLPAWDKWQSAWLTDFLHHGVKVVKIIIIHKKSTSRGCLVFKAFNSQNTSLMIKVYCTYVRPMLEYCCPVAVDHW